MDKQELEGCVEECELSLKHLKEAMSYMDNEYSKQKLEYAARDIKECITACNNLLK